jgi:hypothetical protein
MAAWFSDRRKMNTKNMVAAAGPKTNASSGLTPPFPLLPIILSSLICVLIRFSLSFSFYFAFNVVCLYRTEKGGREKKGQ